MRVLADIRHRQLTRREACIATFAGAALTALCSRLAFHLPGNPVPVTMQTFAVILCGLVLGSRLGAVAQLQYIAMGLLGAPVFAGIPKAGPAVLLGPTGGYLIGFVAAAYLTGLLAERSRPTTASAMTAGLAGVAAIYSVGAPWMAIWCGLGSSKWAGLALGIAPFAAADAAKVACAAVLATNMTRRQ